MRPGIGRVDLLVGVLADVIQTDQRLRESMRMMNVVESEPAFDAQAVVVRRPINAFGVNDLLVLDLVGDLTADTAVRAQRLDFAIRIHRARLVLVQIRGRHQRARRAGLHALSAGDTR